MVDCKSLRRGFPFQARARRSDEAHWPRGLRGLGGRLLSAVKLKRRGAGAAGLARGPPPQFQFVVSGDC